MREASGGIGRALGLAVILTQPEEEAVDTMVETGAEGRRKENHSVHAFVPLGFGNNPGGIGEGPVVRGRSDEGPREGLS